MNMQTPPGGIAKFVLAIALCLCLLSCSEAAVSDRPAAPEIEARPTIPEKEAAVSDRPAAPEIEARPTSPEREAAVSDRPAAPEIEARPTSPEREAAVSDRPAAPEIEARPTSPEKEAAVSDRPAAPEIEARPTIPEKEAAVSDRPAAPEIEVRLTIPEKEAAVTDGPAAPEIEVRLTIDRATVPEACNYLADGNTIEDLWAILSDNGDGTLSADWATNDTDCYAWNAFVALSWPSIGQTNSGNSEAEPDSSQTIGDPGFVVWQRWKNTGDVFLENGASPAGWDPYIGPPQAVIDQAQESGLCGTEGDCSNQPFQDIRLIQQADALVFKSNEDLDGQPIRYEIDQNESTFDYIVDNGIYNVNGQEALAASCPEPTEWPPADEDRCASFPRNAVETKAAWLWVPADSDKLDEIKSRYITAIGYYQQYDNNGQPILDDNGDPVYEVALVALTGFHLTTKALPDWVWTTFENQYNDQYTQATIEVPIASETEQINWEYQAWLEGLGTEYASQYANYLLVGTQTVFDGPPDIQGGELLANSQIESYFQFASSCITCHAFSSVTDRTDLPLHYSFVDSREGNLTYFVGTIPEEVTQDIISKSYRDLDYVWSLRLAKRDRTQP